MFGIGFLFFNRFLSNLGSGATSLFDVQRWTFDVGRSSFSMLDVHLLIFEKQFNAFGEKPLSTT